MKDHLNLCEASNTRRSFLTLLLQFVYVLFFAVCLLLALPAKEGGSFFLIAVFMVFQAPFFLTKASVLGMFLSARALWMGESKGKNLLLLAAFLASQVGAIAFGVWWYSLMSQI